MQYILLAILKSLGILMLAGLGVLMGRKLSRSRHFGAYLLYGIMILLCGLVGATVWIPHLQVYAPFKWVVKSRNEFVLLALIAPLLMTALLCQLDRKRLQVLTALFTGVFTTYFSVIPFLLPALSYTKNANFETTIDQDGVCLQSSSYSCGPASAVTALSILGIPAEESTLCLMAYTTNLQGTYLDNLSAAIKKEYGLSSRITIEDSITDLKGFGPLIAQIKYLPATDHFVAILSITDDTVIVGDPLTGLYDMSPEDFDTNWRNYALIFKPTSR